MYYFRDQQIEHQYKIDFKEYPEKDLKDMNRTKMYVKEIHKVKMTEYIARIFQHEYDHMEGIDFTQRNVVE